MKKDTTMDKLAELITPEMETLIKAHQILTLENIAIFTAVILGGYFALRLYVKVAGGVLFLALKLFKKGV